MVIIGTSAYADVAEFEERYAQFLQSYLLPTVEINGVQTVVYDYARIKRDAEFSGSLYVQTLTALEGVDVESIRDPEVALAFWLNAYNFSALKLVVEHYPVKSIRSPHISLFGYPWSKEAIRIDGRGYSLEEIEKDILLKRYDDPRIVFAVSCPAISCPDRMIEPYNAGRVYEQIDETVRRFLENPTKGLRLDRDSGHLTLSWILNKDRRLFGNSDVDIINFILPYLDADMRRWLKSNPVVIDYFEHDWTLNDPVLRE